MQKTILIVLISFIAGVILTGSIYSYRDTKHLQNDIQRFEQLRQINSDLSRQLATSLELNKSVTRRLEKAGLILDRISGQTTTDNNTIERIRKNVQRLEQKIYELYQVVKS